MSLYLKLSLPVLSIQQDVLNDPHHAVVRVGTGCSLLRCGWDYGCKSDVGPVPQLVVKAVVGLNPWLNFPVYKDWTGLIGAKSSVYSEASKVAVLAFRQGVRQQHRARRGRYRQPDLYTEFRSSGSKPSLYRRVQQASSEPFIRLRHTAEWSNQS